MADGFPTPPSSAFDPPPPSRWWSQLQSLHARREKLTEEESSAVFKPFLCSLLTVIVVVSIVFLLINYFNSLRCHVSFSVESISVSPSSTSTWHVDFLVKNPSSRCPIYYDGDYLYAKLGSLNAVVLNTSHTGRSRGLTSFSVDFATSNQSDVVSASPRVFELDIKLRAKRKQLVDEDEIGHFDIRCQNLMIGHEKIKCQSTFKKLEPCC